MLGSACAETTPRAAPDARLAASDLASSTPWHRLAVIHRDDGTPTVSFELPTRTAFTGSHGTDPAPPTTRVGASLADAIADRDAGGPSTQHTVVAWLRDDGALRDGLPPKVVWQGWVEGTWTTPAQWEAAYDAALLAREVVIDDMIDDALLLLGGTYTVIGRGTRMPFLVLSADVDTVDGWIAADVFGAIEEDAPLADEADGQDLETYINTTDLYGPGYSVATPSSRQYDGAPHGSGAPVILEALGPPRHDHLVLMEAASAVYRPLTKTVLTNSSGFTVINTPDILCDGSSGEICVQHAMEMVQVFGGDITTGQVTPAPTHAHAVQRSGVARGSRPQLATAQGYESGYVHALDRLATRRYPLLSTSFQTVPGGKDCEQDGVDERALNEAYSLGSAIIKSAGNVGNNLLNRCEITPPGAAASAVVVGSVEDNSWEWHSGSSRGHRTGRSIVDVAGFEYWNHPAMLDGSFATPVEVRNGTSYATAMVAGVVWTHRQQFIDRAGGVTPLSSDPGMLQAHLLLMGDGADGQGGTMASGYSRMTGAGFLRALRFEGDDLGPVFASGSVCVEQDTRVGLQLSGSLPPGVTQIHAVAHWVDRRTEEGNDANRIDLEVSTSGGLVARDAGPDEDKRRIRASGSFAGQALWLTLEGFDVRGDSDPFCPTSDSQRVWFALRAF